MQDLLLFSSPFLAIVAIVLGWSVPRLAQGIFRSIVWKKETVTVRKYYKDGLPWFTYTLAGKPITSDRLSDELNDGADLTFVYPPGSPEKGRLRSELSGWTPYIGVFIVGCISAGFLGWFLTDSVETIRIREARVALRNTGVKITIPYAKLSIIQEPGDDKVDTYFRVKALGFDSLTQQNIEFYSRYYKFDPTEELEKLSHVLVYKSPTNKKQYMMDIALKGKTFLVADKPIQKGPIEKGWILFLFGLVVTSLMAFLVHREFQLLKSGERALAKVLYFVSGRSRSGGIVYYPFVQFSKPNGDVVGTELPPGSNFPDNEIGDIVPVFYQVSTSNEITDLTSLNYTIIIVYVVFAFIGTLLMMAGIYFFSI